MLSTLHLPPRLQRKSVVEHKNRTHSSRRCRRQSPVCRCGERPTPPYIATRVVETPPPLSCPFPRLASFFPSPSAHALHSSAYACTRLSSLDLALKVSRCGRQRLSCIRWTCGCLRKLEQRMSRRYSTALPRKRSGQQASLPPVNWPFGSCKRFTRASYRRSESRYLDLLGTADGCTTLLDACVRVRASFRVSVCVVFACAYACGYICV